MAAKAEQTERVFHNPNITYTTLEAAGYRRWNSKGLRQYATCLWQKRFRDERGTKYFIDIYEYDNADMPWHPQKDIVYEPEVSFKLPDDQEMRVSLHARREGTIEEIEAFFEKMFQSMGCLHYELND